MDLSGVIVADVVFDPARLVGTVRLRSRKLRSPECDFTTGPATTSGRFHPAWRHLDLGSWRREVRAVLRRLACPVHGARTEGVPFARAGSRFTGVSFAQCSRSARLPPHLHQTCARSSPKRRGDVGVMSG